jgi:uncharacterized membrane protein YphA (DoxX/SURF4 family)
MDPSSSLIARALRCDDQTWPSQLETAGLPHDVPRRAPNPWHHGVVQEPGSGTSPRAGEAAGPPRSAVAALDGRDASIATVTLRLALASAWIPTGAELVSGSTGQVSATRWIPSSGLLLPSWLHGGALLAVALPLALGWRTRHAALGAVALTLLIHVERLHLDPMYPPLPHVAPFLAIALAILWSSERGDRFGLDGLFRRDAASSARTIIPIAARLFVGTIFLAQGWHDLRAVGAVEFARTVYVEPYRTTFLPTALLWIAGVANPFVQVVCGLALTGGVRVRGVAALGGAFLLTIVIGHLVADPFDVAGDLHQYAWQNLAAMLVVMWVGGPDPLSIGRLFALHGRHRPQPLR